MSVLASELLAGYGQRARVGADRGALAEAACWDRWAELESLRAIDAAWREDGRHVQRRIARDDIEGALAAGKTVCGDISAQPEVAAWLRAAAATLGTGPGGYAKLYVSPPGAGFGLHWDGDHVFVVQCRGRKRWDYGETPTLEGTRRSGTLEDGQAVFVPSREPAPAGRSPALQTHVLSPGEALYLPPGTWHRAEAEGLSVAVSLSPARPSAHALMRSALAPLGTEAAELRAGAPFEGPGSLVAQIEAARDAWVDALRALDPRDLAEQWAAHAAPPGTDGDRALPITRDTHLRVVGALPALVREDGQPHERLVFFGGGQRWALPLEARPFLEGLRAADTFEAREAARWDPKLTWPEARALLEDLLRGGVLARV